MSAAGAPLLAQLVIVTSVLSLLSLLALHVVSAEFQPSWRMISEYALGQHRWLITAFFILWGISSLLLSLLLWPVVTRWWAVLGVALLLLSGIGEIMGGLFDVKHPWHGLAFGLGVPSLPLAALLIAYNLVAIEDWSEQRSTLLIFTHATWISLIVMAIAMAVMFAGFKRAGIEMSANAPPLDRVPEGVTALGGYANRLLVLCYVGWLIVIAKLYLSIHKT
jgi:Protein of unknown function (DUF998)